MMKVLIIEQQQALQSTLEYDLLQYNYDVKVCHSRNKCLNLLKDDSNDLIIIDDNIVDLEILDIIKEIRSFNKKIKIIFLLNDENEIDIISNLEAGANDYLVKPFSARILAVKIKVLLRDIAENKLDEKITNRVKVDYAKRMVFLDDAVIKLTKIEYDLFIYLIKHKNMVVSRKDIMENIWQYKYEKKNRTVDVYVHSLKKKLDLNDILENKRGIGYILNI